MENIVLYYIVLFCDVLIVSCRITLNIPDHSLCILFWK